MVVTLQSVWPTIKERELCERYVSPSWEQFLNDQIVFVSLFDKKFDCGGNGLSFDRRERYELIL